MCLYLTFGRRRFGGFGLFSLISAPPFLLNQPPFPFGHGFPWDNGLQLQSAPCNPQIQNSACNCKSAPSSACTRPQQPQQPRLRPPRSSRPVEERKAFIVRSPLGVLPPACALRETVTALFHQHMPELRGSTGLHLTDATRIGDQSRFSRVYFTVANLEQADNLVRLRCKLRGSGISVFDVLSPGERRLHQQARQKASKQGRGKASKAESKQASKGESKQARGKASKQARRKASKQGGKQASKQGGK